MRTIADSIKLATPPRPECNAGYIRRNSDLTHALLQGGHAADIAASAGRDNPYSDGSVWRWAWFTGFDLGRRIARLQRESFNALCNRVAGEIPEGWSIDIILSRDAGCVNLNTPEGDDWEYASNHERIEHELVDALEEAIAQAIIPEPGP
jgi:hypothetical protein